MGNAMRTSSRQRHGYASAGVVAGGAGSVSLELVEVGLELVEKVIEGRARALTVDTRLRLVLLVVAVLRTLGPAA